MESSIIAQSKKVIFQLQSNFIPDNQSIYSSDTESEEDKELRESVEQNSVLLEKIKSYMNMASFEFMEQATGSESTNLEDENHVYRIKNPLRIFKRFRRRFKLSHKSLIDDTCISTSAPKIIRRPASQSTRNKSNSKSPITNVQKQPNQIYYELLDLVIFFFFAFEAIIETISCVFLYLYDLLSGNQELKIRTGANRTEQCALKQDIYFEGKALERRESLMNSVYFLNLLGEPLVSLVCIPSCYYFVLASYPLIYYYSNLILFRSMQTPVSFLNFLFHPIQERLRVRKNISNMFRLIVRSAVLDESKQQIYPDTRQSSNYFSNDYADEARKKQNFIKLFCDKKFEKAIRPANLSAEWHRRQLNLARLTMRLYTSTMLAGWIMFFPMVFLVLRKRTQQRLSIVRCQQWNLNATSIEYSYVLLDDLSSGKDLKAYLAYDEATSSNFDLIKLILFIEAKYYFTLKRVFRLVCMQTSTVISSTVFTYHFVHYVHSILDKLTWLKQISDQVESCIVELLSLHHKCAPLERTTRATTTSSPIETELKFDQIIKSITITYLNFELFSREQKDHKRIANLMLAQEALHVLALMCCYYLGSRQFDAYNSFLIFGACYVVLCANFYLVLGAMLTRRVENLMRQVMILATISYQVFRNKRRPTDFAIGLWHRQMVSEFESRRLFAPNLLGMSLTYGKLLSLNLYLLALCMFLTKVKL